MSAQFSIPVTDILRACTCPMQLYLARSVPEDFHEPLRYSVAKQISYHLGDPLSREKIWQELTLTLPGCGEDAKTALDQMIDACSRVTWRHALTHDMQVESEKFNIHGRIDRVFDDSFSIIKGGRAPTHGVYATDRLQAVCYSICLEEMYGKEFYGRIEYLGSGTIRSVVVSPSDKRAFLEALKTVEKIRRGEIPRAIRGAKCRWCRFAESCKPLEKPPTLFERMKMGKK
ncbi:MAG: Dna2/Cas4 domain-containing protein [Methanocorpusculum sp.]|nr:Dna2/Cas4 domain-containing protein [Methanocorpusculum sp.]